MFKKRGPNLVIRNFRFRLGDSGFFTLVSQRFELIYLRGFKKLIRRRHIKAKMKFKRRKFWFFLKPNCILSGKSVNSRMGAGVGAVVRVSLILKSYKSFVEFQDYSPYWLTRVAAKLRYKYPLKFIFKDQC